MDHDDLAHLHIRSGEHIAAILLIAFLRRAPSSVDTTGDVDLLFDLTDQPDDLRTTVDLGALAAFEIKSLPGDYRRHEAGETDPSTAEPHYAVIRSASDIMREAVPSLRAAARSLARKCPGEWSRNAFLVIHPFDHLAIEAVQDELMAPALEPLPEAASLDLDTVWVLWVPDHLTMWSVADQRWTEMNYRGVNPGEDPAAATDGLSVLQAAEAAFLDRIGARDGSPYLFRMTFSDGGRPPPSAADPGG